MRVGSLGSYCFEQSACDLLTTSLYFVPHIAFRYIAMPLYAIAFAYLCSRYCCRLFDYRLLALSNKGITNIIRKLTFWVFHSVQLLRVIDLLLLLLKIGLRIYYGILISLGILELLNLILLDI